MQVVI